MDEDNSIRPLDRLLAMLKDAGWDCIADEADSSLIVIDANGDPHECWDGGTPGYVNVCIALSIENAMDYFSDPNQIYLKDENARLRSCLSDDAENARQIMGENAKLRELCKSMRCALVGHEDKVYLDALDETLIGAGFDLQKLGIGLD